MTDITPKLEALHAIYVRETQLEAACNMHKLGAWEVWLTHGWTQEDLVLVIRALKAKVKAGQKWPSCLNFRKLIVDTEAFEEELCEARARSRTRRVDPARERVLRCTARSAEPKPKPMATPAQILAGKEAFEAFKRLKDQL